jgi:hypothetical protein
VCHRAFSLFVKPLARTSCRDAINFTRKGHQVGLFEIGRQGLFEALPPTLNPPSLVPAGSFRLAEYI